GRGATSTRLTLHTTHPHSRAPTKDSYIGGAYPHAPTVPFKNESMAHSSHSRVWKRLSQLLGCLPDSGGNAWGRARSTISLSGLAVIEGWVLLRWRSSGPHKTKRADRCPPVSF